MKRMLSVLVDDSFALVPRKIAPFHPKVETHYILDFTERTKMR